MHDLRGFMHFAAETVHLAGRLTLGYFGTGVRPDYKPDDTPVTVADRLSEELIRRRIEEHYPQHSIVGEEFGVKATEGAAHRWFIDPIDGTKSFIRGVPLYAVLLGLEVEGVVRVGAAYYPGTDELLCAAGAKGRGGTGGRRGCRSWLTSAGPTCRARTRARSRSTASRSAGSASPAGCMPGRAGATRTATCW